MSIFDMHRLVIDEYRQYVQSFLSVSDERIRGYIEDEVLTRNRLWPDALLQLNPAYSPAATVDDLCQQGRLHRELARIFRDRRGGGNRPLVLRQHQEDAISLATAGDHFVVTSGTGSGKSLAYFIPIFDAVLRGDPSREQVTAIVVYPMNALVNSQEDALKELARAYQAETGTDLPVRFSKYTGQEDGDARGNAQRHPPHILLTNYVMLELMLVRPEEHTFVDHTTADLRFLVLDELHTYRGRQGADIAMLVRRLRERCGNADLQCIGTSATMVAGEATTPEQRRAAVAQFASRLFGAAVAPSHVVEESLRRVTDALAVPGADALRRAVQSLAPHTAAAMRADPLTAWIELTFGVQPEADGRLRRLPPISLQEGAERLALATGLDVETCLTRLRDAFLLGSHMLLDDGTPLFAFKLHQFIAQGRTVYATLEPSGAREFSLEGQYYAAAAGGGQRLLYPLHFCRVCGQDHYLVVKRDAEHACLPFDPGAAAEELLGADESSIGYLMLAPAEAGQDWDEQHLPAEWLERNGRVKRNYRPHVPMAVWVNPDGSFSAQGGEGAAPGAAPGAVKAWFQPKPFMLCQNCGEFYTLRDRSDFRKLTGLSSEGRSTSTTVLTVSALQHAPAGGIGENARKVLSFTDNRQDASLQAGHFNDFVQVSLLRSAIYAALAQHHELRFDTVAARVTECMGLALGDVAANADLEPDTPQGRAAWETFQRLVEYRVYEDLRRGWRVVQPNLEQCGLLRITYAGLDQLCADDAAWQAIDPLGQLTRERRRAVVTALLDHFRRKLAIRVTSLDPQAQQQLIRQVAQQIGRQWGFDEDERPFVALRFVLPGQAAGDAADTMSLAENSLIGRYLRQALAIHTPYADFARQLVDLLCRYGVLTRVTERNVEMAQLDASALIWTEGDGSLATDPIYTRRAAGPLYAQAQREANAYFREFYQRAAGFLRGIEGREHTAQVSNDDRRAREDAFREGRLKLLFCSPTMELGVDIQDLQIVHLRNVPPTPANYAQRSGRAGRGKDPALVMTYCASGSGHDQYFFRRRQEMVAGSVRPPRIDLSSPDLIKAHVHALWLAAARLSLGHSIVDVVELELPGHPLKESVRGQIQLPDQRLSRCIDLTRRVLRTCEPDLSAGGWYTEDWLAAVVRSAAADFDAAFNRFRELYAAAQRQWAEANAILQHPTRDAARRQQAEIQRGEAERQMNLLCNMTERREESDFYPYRYLASEGFLPGYNFPRLPIRAYVRRGRGGDYIARPRFLALQEFGPRNIVYHEGAKYDCVRLIAPPGGLLARRTRAKMCGVCGYYHPDPTASVCENCHTALDASNSDIAALLDMPNVSTARRERITCDEEERVRRGYTIGSYFRFAPAPGGQARAMESFVHDGQQGALLRLVYAPAATLYRVNHGWRSRRDQGFPLDMATGEWVSGGLPDADAAPANAAPANAAPADAAQIDVVRLVASDTLNLLLVYPCREGAPWDAGAQATLQYALQRGIEQTFQIEESELASERIGAGEHSAILFWEASEGGAGVLRRIVEERDALARVASAALERCHFDVATLNDERAGDCARACYDCLLSYSNQRDHAILDRHLARDVLHTLTRGQTLASNEQRDYDSHYQWLRGLTDTRSDLERRFLDHLYNSRRRLPDAAQARLADYACVPDFFCAPNVCVFCDGTVHDGAAQRAGDARVRAELRDLGYRVVVIRYDQDVEAAINACPDVFGAGVISR